MMNRNFGIEQQHDDPLVFQNPWPIFAAPNHSRINWKIKKAADKRKKVASKRFYPKKKFTRFVPLAPRNTTSFIIRAKKSGGIVSLVSPSPVTPVILPTPKFSPWREGLVDMAKEEWGVDGYGSMNGLIRIRSVRGNHSGSSERDDLSRFEIVNLSFDPQIVRLEEENLCLKERLFLMEGEMEDLRRRLQNLQRINNHNRNNNNNINNDHNNHDNECSYSEDNNMNANEEKIIGEDKNNGLTPG